jgi:hypothetical protein
MEHLPIVEDQQLAVLQVCHALLYALAQAPDTLHRHFLDIAIGENKELLVWLALSSLELLLIGR